MGHEISGTIDAVGPDVDSNLLGQPVVINPLISCNNCAYCRGNTPQLCKEKVLIGCSLDRPGGFADAVVVPATAAIPWHGEADLLLGAFAEPLAVGVHAAVDHVTHGSDVLVIGSGAVGVSAGWAASYFGGKVQMLDQDGTRTEIMDALGLSHMTLTQVRRTRYDTVIDCLASSESVDLALSALRPGGTVVVVGLGCSKASLSVERLVQGERALRGSAQYSSADFNFAVDAISTGALSLDGVLGDPVDLADAPALIDSWAEDAIRPLRTLVSPLANQSSAPS